MAVQKSLPGLVFSSVHGDGARRGKRKGARPIATKRPMHFVVRSGCAVGELSMLNPRNAGFIRELVARLCRKWGVRVYAFSNNGNHLHLLLQSESRDGFRNFSRTLTALIARHVTGARKGHRLKQKFWDCIPFTRIVEWGRAFAETKNYIQQNVLEALRAVAYHPRTTATPWRLNNIAPHWRSPTPKNQNKKSEKQIKTKTQFYRR